ncbi:uncharacterized protein LOC131928695 [Physella acuta]|uniref:uncharacterized protein LOC131928695 n=1 Tax=Physella acuta TaxID=109671 RepID=UPI0027DDAEB4|nr:uncharacterized protein LOC131928695 [Physella acuta]
MDVTDVTEPHDYLELRESLSYYTAPTVTGPSSVTHNLFNNSTSLLRERLVKNEKNNTTKQTDSPDSHIANENMLNGGEKVSPSAVTSVTDTSRPLPPTGGQGNVTKAPPYYNIAENKTNPKGVAMNSDDVDSKNKTKQQENRRPTYSKNLQSRNEQAFNFEADHYDVLRGTVNPSEAYLQFMTNSARIQRRQGVKWFFLYLTVVLLGFGSLTGAIFGGIIGIGDNVQENINTQLKELNANISAMLSHSRSDFLNHVKDVCLKNKSASDIRFVFGSNCYCLYRKRLSWSQAKDFCLNVGNGVYFAEIHDSLTNEFLMPLLTVSQTNLGIWLGGSDLEKEGVWKWATSGVEIEKFNPSQWAWNEPSNTSHLKLREDCLDIWNWQGGNFKWNDHGCDDLKPFLCMSRLENDVCYC